MTQGSPPDPFYRGASDALCRCRTQPHYPVLCPGRNALIHPCPARVIGLRPPMCDLMGPRAQFASKQTMTHPWQGGDRSRVICDGKQWEVGGKPQFTLPFLPSQFCPPRLLPVAPLPSKQLSKINSRCQRCIVRVLDCEGEFVTKWP